jgi:hypothetical protein
MPIEDRPIETDTQKGLLDALVALRQTFLDGGVTVTRQEVAGWLTGINAISSWPQWRSYEKKRTLLEIEMMLALLRRLP